EIEHDDVGALATHLVEPCPAGGRRHDGEPDASQIELEQASDIALVFDDDHAAFHRVGHHSVVTCLSHTPGEIRTYGGGMRCVLLLVLAAASACSSRKAEAPGERSVRIAAAADLAKAFTEIAAEFKTKTGITANLEFGSSGLLAKQI